MRQGSLKKIVAYCDRLLVGTDEAHPSGQTEFQARDLLLRAGAKACEAFRAQQQTAPRGPASPAPAAARPPPSTATAPRSRCVGSAPSAAAALPAPAAAAAGARALGTRPSAYTEAR